MSRAAIVALLALAAAPSSGLAKPPSAVKAHVYPLMNDDVVRVMPLRGLSARERSDIDMTMYSDEDVTPWDADACPTRRVVLSVETQAAMVRANGDVRDSQGHVLAGLFLHADGGGDCHVMLNGRVIHRLDDEAQVCNLVEHELGHARGYAHTTTGLMQPVLPVLPVPECAWAQSSW